MKLALYGFTDYPFPELGDTSNQVAPVRACKILSYDQDKYCWIDVFNGNCKPLRAEIKRGYLYKDRKPYETATRFKHKEIQQLPETPMELNDE